MTLRNMAKSEVCYLMRLRYDAGDLKDTILSVNTNFGS